MSRKDFELIAKVLKAEGASEALCLAMAEQLKLTNAAFNMPRFLEACGY